MDQIDYVLTRGVEKIYPTREALEKVLRSGKKLRLYQGFDPTSSKLHLGHMVGLRKLSQFQKLGHGVIFLIGDFTGRIGDPTDKTAARVRLTEKQVNENLSTFKAQAENILSFKGPNAAHIKFNATWLSKLTFDELIELASHFTVPQLLERDMYQERMRQKKTVYLHEFFYPLMQGYDSVAMNVDLEVGGTDQTFNMLAGRTLMQALKQKEKYVLTTKLLTDSAGAKMGKTTGNFVALTDNPEDMFIKTMSFPDTFLPSFVELLTDLPTDTPLDKPLELKKRVAHEIVTQVHGQEKARGAQMNFERVVQGKELPIERLPLPPAYTSLATVQYMVDTHLAESKSQARRLIEQGGLMVNGQKITDLNHKVTPTPGTIFQVGKYKVGEVANK